MIPGLQEKTQIQFNKDKNANGGRAFKTLWTSFYPSTYLSVDIKSKQNLFSIESDILLVQEANLIFSALFWNQKRIPR